MNIWADFKYVNFEHPVRGILKHEIRDLNSISIE